MLPPITRPGSDRAWAQGEPVASELSVFSGERKSSPPGCLLARDVLQSRSQPHAAGDSGSWWEEACEGLMRTLHRAFCWAFLSFHTLTSEHAFSQERGSKPCPSLSFLWRDWLYLDPCTHGSHS